MKQVVPDILNWFAYYTQLELSKLLSYQHAGTRLPLS
jgi:hypothetical protein